MSAITPTTGTRAVCRSCGAAIEYIGPHWRHVGPHQPRHPAQPAEPPAGDATAPASFDPLPSLTAYVTESPDASH